MIHSINLKGYRGFTNFSMNELGRLNLLVGKNNSGKSSILDALSLLWSGANLAPLWQILSKRGETSVPELVPARAVQLEVDVAHIFSGHQAKLGSQFSITTTNDEPGRTLTYSLAEPKPEENPPLFGLMAGQEPAGALMALKVSGCGINSAPIPLTQRGTLRNDVFSQVLAAQRPSPNQGEPAQFVTTESLTPQQLAQLWNDIALKPEEDLVLKALQFLDPTIERIAPIAGPVWFAGARGGFMVRRKNEERIPIGSLGDGIWRMFALAVAISRAKGSLLLIDEIDTGLHYSVMEKMWRFVNDVSKAFNAQVFATTHSYDCVNSLSYICQDNPVGRDITIQRIENEKAEAIRYTESEIKIAARHHIEMR